jgi:hypothetical protein
VGGVVEVPAASGTVTVSGLAAGSYRVTLTVPWTTAAWTGGPIEVTA